MTIKAFPPEYRQPKHVDITDTVRADVPANDGPGPFSIRLIEVGCEGPVFYEPGRGLYCRGFYGIGQQRHDQLERQLDEAGKIGAVKAAFEKLRPLNADEAFTSSGLRVRTAFEFYQDGSTLAYKLPLASGTAKLVGQVAIDHESGLVAGSRRLYTLMCEQLFEYETRTAPRPFAVGFTLQPYLQADIQAATRAWRQLYPPTPRPFDAEMALDTEVRQHAATRNELADAKRKIAKLEEYNAQAAQTNRQLAQRVQDERLAFERMREDRDTERKLGRERLVEIDKLDGAVTHQKARVTRALRALCDVKNGKEPQGIGFLSSADGNAYGVIEFDR